MDTYRIIRYYADLRKKPRVMARGFSLEDARKHCSKPTSKKEGVWFEGFSKEK